MGAGEVGKHLAVELVRQKHDITLIDRDQELVDGLLERFTMDVYCGNGTLPVTLAEVNVSQADLFLAITNLENTNLVAAAVAKRMKVPRAIARVHKAHDSQWLFDYEEGLDIDHLLCVEQLAAQKLFKFVHNPTGLQSQDIPQSKIELREVEVSEESSLIGTSIASLELPKGVRFATVQRRDKGRDLIRFPRGEDELRPGDKVILFGKSDPLWEITTLLNPALKPGMKTRVVIMGGNEYTERLANMIRARGIHLTIIEKSKEVCERIRHLSEEGDTTIINGDPTSREVLEEEDVGNADLFIAASNDDEDNIMTCMQADDLGSVRCIPLIHRPANAMSIQSFRSKLGIHEVVCPRIEAAQDLLRYVENDENYHHVCVINEDIEVIQVTVREGSPVVDRPVGDIDWPEEGSLVCLIEEKASIVPTGKDVLRTGHVVFVVVTRKSKKPFVRLLSGGQ